MADNELKKYVEKQRKKRILIKKKLANQTKKEGLISQNKKMNLQRKMNQKV